MNKHLYRLVFNHALMLWQVAAEITPRPGGAGTGQDGDRTAALRPMAFALWVMLGWVGVSGLAAAQVVADPNAPGNQRPTVLETANGTPQINIQTPSAAGVSRNTYQRFDVDQQGAILNNSRGNTQSQLGGWVQGNPWLAGGTARVILNEINGANPSQLRGYVEVAGDRAQVVIANPAGIDCDGCGFINANRITLTTGTPTFNGGALEGYRVQGGAIHIFGAGMDASRVDYTDLIARSVQLNAGLWAQQLQVTTGANTVSADLSRVQAQAADGSTPQYALDVAQLGGMYANKILLMGTEHGVGVRNAGNLGAQTGELVVTVDGRLENTGKLQARDDTRIAASGGVRNEGLVSAGRELKLHTGQDLDNRGGQLNGTRLDLEAASLVNRGGSIEQAGVQALAVESGQLNNRDKGSIGALAQQDGTAPTTPGTGEGTGNPGTPGTGNGSTDGSAPGVIPPTTAPLAQGRVVIAGLLDNDAGAVLAGGDIDLRASGLDNDGGSIGVRDLTVNGGVLSNRQGELTTQRDLRVQGQALHNDAGALNVGGALDVRTTQLSNRSGKITHSGTAPAQLQVAGTLDNTDGSLASNAASLALTSAMLVNTDGTLLHAGSDGLQLTTGTLDGQRGEIATAGTLSLRAGQVDHRQAELQAGMLDVQVDTLDNRGGQLLATGSQANRIEAATALDNSDGTLASNGDLAIDTVLLSNAGGQVQQAGSGRLDITAATLAGAGGKLLSNGALHLQGQRIDVSGGIASAVRMEIDAGQLDNRRGELIATGTDTLGLRVTHALQNDSGQIIANGALALQAGSLSNRDGKLLAAGSAASTLQVTGAFDNQRGTLASAGDLTLQAGQLDNQAGTVQAAGDRALQLSVDGLLDNRQAGLIASGGAQQLRAGNLGNRGGTVNAGDTLEVTVTQSLDNSAGTLAANDTLHVQAGRIINRDAGTLASVEGDVTLDSASDIDNTAGVIQAERALSVTSQGLTNVRGTLAGASVALDTGLGGADNSEGIIAATAGTLDIRSGVLENRAGLLQSSGGMSIDTHGQRLGNTDAGARGGIVSGAGLTLRAGELDNRAGLVQAQTALDARLASLDNRSGGQVGSGASLLLQAQRVDNSGGRLQAAQNLTLDLSGELVNQAGLAVAGGDLVARAARIDNRATSGGGTALGLQGRNVDLTAAQIDNSSGMIAADQRIALQATDALFNQQGLVSSAGSLDVRAGQVGNADGTLLSAGNQMLHANALNGTGRVLSQGDLVLALQQDYRNDGQITANGKATVSTQGLWTNAGKVQAGDLNLHARQIDNLATGEISGIRTQVRADGVLGNRGLIDGVDTRVDADVILNVGTGRIYGDRLSIGANTLVNSDETLEGVTRAATIAARERLDIGAGTVVNREQALIFSAGGGDNALNIGGALDAQGHAVGRAGAVHNASATIESLGGLSIDATRLLNSNEHFATTEVMVVGPTKKLYIQPKGTPGMHDASEFTWSSWSRAGKYWWKNGNGDVKDWTQYDVTHTEYETQVASSAPGRIISGGNMTLRGDELINDKSQILAGGALLGDLGNLRNIDAFGEYRVHEEGTSQYTYSRWRGGFKRYHERKWDRKIAYRPADEVRTINLGVTRTAEHTRDGGSGYQVGGVSTGTVGGQVGGAAEAGAVGGQRQVTEVSASVASLAGPGSNTGTGAQGAAGNQPTVIRTIGVEAELPQSSLFQSGPDAGQYLVETDPRFADYRNWLGSEYLLQKMGVDPANVQKRLGDGFYEQKLVRDQVAQLTGRRFLDGYVDDEAQYRALLDNAATIADAWGLRPGVALTPAQMAQLTSDIVWLVEQRVTLADGSTTTALVPQVYVRVRPGDIDGTGTLLAGRSVELNLRGDLVNSGTIAGRTAVKIDAQNLRNLDGRISGDTVSANARTDLDNLGGLIDARSVLVASAGRDLNMVTTTRSGQNTAGLSDFSRTNIDRVAGLFVSDQGATLLAKAGRDLRMDGAQVVNTGAQGQTLLSAGRDLSLGTVTEARQENNVRNNDNYLRQGYEREVGTTLDTAGAVQLQAGHDVNLRAAQVYSSDGAISVMADNDVSIASGEQSNNWSEGRKHTHRGLLKSTTNTTRDSLEETQAIASTLSGHQVAVRGNNITVTGSNVVSDAGTVLLADNDLTVQAATNTRGESHYKRKDESGFLYNGGVAFTVGTQMQSRDAKDVSTSAAASTIGSTAGNVVMVAGNNYRQVGSHVVAPEGDIDIHARKVDIVEARETGVATQEDKFRQAGLTVALTAPVISAIQSAEQMKKAASQTDDSRMKTLAAATTVLNTAAAVGAVQADPGAAGGINISITVGGARSDSKTTTTHDNAAGSSITAGGDVRISATGAGKDSDLTVIGSTINAGNNAYLRADGDIALLAAKNTQETDRKSSAASGGVGVAISIGSGGASAGITANASGSKGKGEGTDVQWTNSHVNAGNTLVLESGGDTTLRGAVASGREVIADIGGDLNIESLQDTSTFHSKDTSVGGSVTVGLGFSGSASYGNTKVDGDYASVVEQSGIKAGDGGYQVRVGGNTDLIGGVIASSEQAIADGRNQLITSTLSVRDLDNRSDYKASSLSLSGGFSKSGTGGPSNGGNSGRGNDGTPGSTGAAGQGSSWSWQNYGNDASAAAPGYASDKGSDASTTRSGISAGALTITDGNAQLARTGKSIDDTLASLNRGVLSGDDANGLIRNWDPVELAQKVQAEAQISAAFTQQAHSAVGSYVASRGASIKERYEHADTPEQKAALQAEADELRTQEKMLNILIGAVTGSATSAVSKEALASAADWMRQEMIKNSQLFPGVTDGVTTLDNIHGKSAGVDGDEFKIGGTRVDLDQLCGPGSIRCATNPDGTLALDSLGRVQFDDKQGGLTLAQYLASEEGKKLGGVTGGIQGWTGTLRGDPYKPGDWQDRLIEYFAGPHDMIGGQLAGLYDEQGNARRGRPWALSTFHEGWTVVAIPVAAPFAMAKALPPQVWSAISILAGASR
ncbi:hemagglutinin repeat-containing protein [Stenotrophomonas sp. PS02301]|uniref:two-partner secretion domain-containing protein n=1 Tax=Stenotrophomonas sp. PS02301 TaxID=2991427 RepID=UPI00249A77F7|nr:hemagglutinin repeat-containing protein [Stenotrophomonas sp. PS02301]